MFVSAIAMSHMLLAPTTRLRAPFCSSKGAARRHVNFRLVCQSAPEGEAPPARAPAAPRRQFTPPADFNPNAKVRAALGGRDAAMGLEVWAATGRQACKLISADAPPPAWHASPQPCRPAATDGAHARHGR